MSQKTVPMIELIPLILSCHLVTVKLMSLKKLQETNQRPIIGGHRERAALQHLDSTKLIKKCKQFTKIA